MLMNPHFSIVKTKIEKQNYFSLAVVGMLLEPGMGKESFCYFQPMLPQTVKQSSCGLEPAKWLTGYEIDG